MRNRLKLKVGLALGGGAARGLAHLGVLKVFEREQLPIDVVVGTSMGAIIGGAWVAGGSVDVLHRRILDVLESDEFKKNRMQFLRETKSERGGLIFSVANLVRRGIFYGVSTLRPSFLSAEEFAGTFAAVIPEVRIEDLPKTFGAVALDIDSADEVVLCRGNLRRAAKASSAIPGILPPIHLNGRVLIDGGWIDKVPVIPTFCLGADVVIAVDITAGLEDVRGYDRGVDIMVRANAIREARLVHYVRGLADIVIEPAVKDVHWVDFGAHERCVAAGIEAAEAALPQIRQLLRQERLFSVVRAGHGRRLSEAHMQSGELKLCIE